MFNWFKSRKLEDVLFETTQIKIKDVKFTIKKINILDYLDGSNLLKQHYDTYSIGKDKIESLDEKKQEKIFKHIEDVLCAGIVYPKVSRKPEEGILVKLFFNDMELALALYTAINEFTYGKKKLK